MNMQQKVEARQPVMSEGRVALLGALLVAIGPISMALFTPAMPELVRAFGTTDAAVKLTLSLYFAGFAVMQLVCGPLADAYGRKPITLIFMGLYLAASLLALLAPNIETLVVARMLQGCGGAVGVVISRAIVRDLFTNERSARIMNLMAMIIGIAPAIAPTMGGLVLETAGWHTLFLLMAAAGLAVIATIYFAMVETGTYDPSRLRPGVIARSYRSLLGDPYFMFASLILAGGAGAMYTQATVLPFIIINRLGLTPTQFGMGMMIQSLSFVAGSIVMRRLMGRYGAFRMVPVGLIFIAAASIFLAVVLRTVEPYFLLVMAPAGIYAFGIAFTMPAMTTASVAAYPHMAGSASSLSGFLQFGGGLLGGLAAAAMGDPIIALATIVPVMGMIAVVSYLLWRRCPEPVMAKVVRPVVTDIPAP